MSALERLVQAKSSNKNYYETRKLEATIRAQPPGGQKVSRRHLQKCVKRVGEAWSAYYNAAINLVDEGVYTEEQDRVNARILVADESIAHEIWFEGVEDVLTASLTKPMPLLTFTFTGAGLAIFNRVPALPVQHVHHHAQPGHHECRLLRHG